MEPREYFVYIVASKRYGTIYTGVTNDLLRRMNEHKQKSIKGFTKKYNVDKLVYFESHSDVYEAISREKTIKKWHRDWKINLIEKNNPQWLDLFLEILK